MGALDTVRRRGLSEGVLGGSRVWLVAGGLAWAVRAVGWAVRRDEKVVFRARLKAGQQLLISERAYESRRRRRKG
jgi:hypothetical protein